jgi:hypothetical protein
MTSSSTALVPGILQEGREREAQPSTKNESAQGGCASPARWSANKKRLIAASIVLAVGAAVLGSVWLGLAAVLPLLYLLPCLAMLAMCMKG